MLLSFAATTVFAFFIAYTDQLAALQVFALLSSIIVIVLKISGLTNLPVDKKSLFYILGFLLAFQYYQARDPSLSIKDTSQEQEMEMSILSFRKRKEESYLLVEGKVEGSFSKSRYLIKESDMLQASEREDIRIDNRYKGFFQISLFAAGGLLGDFDEQAFYYAQGISGILSSQKIYLVKEGANYKQWPLAATTWLEGRTQGLSQPSRDFIHRVFLGKTIDIEDPHLEKQMQALGVSHLLAASGLHVTILYAWGIFLFSKLRIRRIYGNVIIFSLLFAYAWLLNFPASIMRALLFANFRELALISFRRLSYLRRITYSLFFILLIEPYGIGNVGLQLSFLCALAIDMQGRLNQVRPLKLGLVKSLRLTFWVNCLTLPVLVNMSGSFPLATFIANLLLVPFFTVLFSFALLLILLPSLPIFAQIFDFTFAVFSLTVTGLEGLCIGTLSILFLTGGGLLIYYLFVAVLYLWRLGRLFYLLREKSTAFLLEEIRYLRYQRRTLVFCLCLFLGSSWAMSVWNTSMRLTMINVGQGDCFLLEAGEYNLLFDTGGRISFDKQANIQGEKLAQTLKSWGIDRLDGIFISHRDYDHMGNLEELIRHLQVGKIYVSPLRNGHVPRDGLPTTALSRLETLPKEESLQWAGFTIHVLQQGYFDGSDANEDSAVLLLEGDFSVLFMGDAEKVERKWLTDQRVQAIDVLKLAHHGSKGGSSQVFLHWTKPQLALISAGYENRYGHPHGQVLDRLAKEGIPITRTDLEGNRTVTLNKRNGQVIHQDRQDALWAELLNPYLLIMLFAVILAMYYFWDSQVFLD